MGIKEIEAEIRKLTLSDRAALARWLLEHPPTDTNKALSTITSHTIRFGRARWSI
jgi:hypothetical protein